MVRARQNLNPFVELASFVRAADVNEPRRGTRNGREGPWGSASRS